MSLTGHKTASVYLRYAVADLGAQREGVAKVSKTGGKFVRQPENSHYFNSGRLASVNLRAVMTVI